QAQHALRTRKVAGVQKLVATDDRVVLVAPCPCFGGEDRAVVAWRADTGGGRPSEYHIACEEDGQARGKERVLSRPRHKQRQRDQFPGTRVAPQIVVVDLAIDKQ